MSVTRIANGPGNLPDADDLMDNFDYLESLVYGTRTINGGFEIWGGTTTFTNAADSTTVCDSWIYHKSGIAAPSLDVSREATTKDTGSYALKFNITGAGSADSLASVRQAIANPTRFRGKRICVGVKIYCSSANKLRIKLTDGVSTVYSSYHSGGGAYEKLTAVLTVDAGATAITLDYEVNGADFTGAIYFDSGFLYAIPSQMSATAYSSLLFSELADLLDYLPLTGGIVSGNLTVTGTIDAQGQLKGKGTATNDTAGAGYVGETVELYTSAGINYTTSGQYGDYAAMTLTAGEWDLSFNMRWDKNGATVTDFTTYIATVAGNTASGYYMGKNTAEWNQPPANLGMLCVPRYPVQIATTTVYYLKASASFSGGTPQIAGFYFSARRMR